MTATLHASTTQPKEAAYIVYLNGIEIPAISASVDMQTGSLPVATVGVSPDLSMVQLGKEDRVEVQIFYKDDIHSAVDGKAPDFRLLFDGVIAGWSYVNAHNSRAIQFKCVHASQVLETLRPYFITGSNTMVMSGLKSNNAGTTVNLIHSAISLPFSLFFYGFDAKKRNLIKRPYDYIENIFKSCIGAKEAPQLGSAVTSLFYSRYMKKMGLPFRFVPSPIIEIEPLSDPDVLGAFPILKAVRSEATLNALYRKTIETGLSDSILGSVQGVFQQMYYELLSISTAPIARVEMTPDSTKRGMILGPPEWKTEPKKKSPTAEEALVQQKLDDAYRAIENEVLLNADPIEGETLDETERRADLEIKKQYAAIKEDVIREATANKMREPNRPNFLINHITKPQWMFGIPPACNVIFPSMIKELRFDENYADQPTRFYVNDMSVPETVNECSELIRELTAIRYGYPEQVDRELAKRQGGLGGSQGNPLVSGKNFISWPEEFYKGPVSAQAKPPGWLIYLQDELQTNQTAEQRLAREALDIIEQSVTNIWSEAYAQAQAQVQAETAQNTDHTTPEKKAKREKEIRDKINTTMLDKLFDKEKVRITTLKEQGLLPQSINSMKELRESLAQRANGNRSKLVAMMRMLARYEYHRSRSGLQQGSVSMAFNPYIVPGFPAMIFDYFTNGQHFVGYVVSVTHSISTRGWETTAQFVYGQTLDDFVNEVFDARVGNNVDGVLENISSGPPTPVPDLRRVMQHMDKAEEYFSQLFHQGADYTEGSKTKRAAFDFTKSFSFIVPEKTKEAYYSFNDVIDKEAKEQQYAKLKEENTAAAKLETELKIRMTLLENDIRADAERGVSSDMGTEAYIKQEVDRARADQRIFIDELAYEQKIKRESTAPQRKLKNHVLDNYIGIIPTKNFSGMFGNHDIAMKYISRPICTLDEYIAFRGKWGTRQNTIRPDHPNQGKGATYYEQILTFKADDGTPPTFDENNFLVDPKPKDLPDTRKDWTVQLKNYRTKVLFGKLPGSPKE